MRIFTANCPLNELDTPEEGFTATTMHPGKRHVKCQISDHLLLTFEEARAPGEGKRK